MIKIIFETLIFPVLALCLAIALAVEQSPIWWIGALVILLCLHPLLPEIPGDRGGDSH